MRRIIFKGTGYFILVLILLEVVVRFFHLGKDTPLRFIDEQLVEKWVPNQQGISVTGNRNQNSSKFRINKSGFNSFREFNPHENSFEIALVGDSFFQGFHQDYYNSIGAKIEKELPNTEVYEYAYAGYDFADQLHLIHAHKKDFKLIDQVVIYLDYNTDLDRDTYSPIYERIALQSPINLALKNSKLLVYSKSIGLLDSPKQLLLKFIKFFKNNEKEFYNTSNKSNVKTSDVQNRITAFEKLVNQYGFDKSRFSILLDSEKTDGLFLNYLRLNQYEYIDFNPDFKKSKVNTTLIYDKHWNNHGRKIIASLIAKEIKKKL